MIALLVYNRSTGKLVRTKHYDDADVEKANAARLEEEISHAAEPHVEIVILQSKSFDELKRTHARYFSSLQELRASS
jgi:hypothetical protein